MIPKIIHYCWFGGNPLPKLAIKCINSWKKYCPDYKIIEWNEQNFNLNSAPLYVKQAYEAKKWAFVTDYVRLYALTSFGGIYMDTDVEVIKPLDNFLTHSAFSGFENATNIPTGIMACEKNFPLFIELLHYYDNVPFINSDGSYNQTTNVSIITDICLKKGLVQNNQYQIIDNFALYPFDVFCPSISGGYTVSKTDKTHTIHWFSGSWLSDEEKGKKRKAKKKEFFTHMIQTPNRIAISILGQNNYNSLKNKIKK